jgi:hypothetical protein
VTNPGHFEFSIPTIEAERDGWSVLEYSDVRARFASRGQPSSLTVYPDGRAFCDGEFKSISSALPDAAEIELQHESPADISVRADLGRVNRSSAGDANNDGYNESTGTYQLIASGPRIEFTLTPRTRILSRPMIEIANLPAGEAIVTVEGQLLATPRRLPNGNLLIELPSRLGRATLVNVRVQ